MRIVLYTLLCAVLLSACQTQKQETLPNDSIVSKLKLPPGFSISVFAEVENARSLALSPAGIVYVGNRTEDKVYAVQDTDGDFVADKKWILASGLNMPNGVAFHDGDLFVAEVNRILKYEDIESKLDNPGEPVVVYDKLPTETHHGWKYIAFGPDGKLYVPVGAPCNICEPKGEIYAAIHRMNADGTNLELFASGVRNTVGFTWHPQTNVLWFTDNGRDNLGDDIPPCELNTAPTAGLHFGYPYCHGGTLQDPEFGDKHACDEFVKPEFNFEAHVAPLGLKFYTGTMFPSEYQNQLIVAEHGSWNRSKKSGYKLNRVKFDANGVATAETFVSGWLNEESQEVSGRPVDVLQLPDGSLLVSDDHAGRIYRIAYSK
ncbi:MAG TPA: sorbosone dehydrogenase family protein [Cyclobacteriaceae bacterium]|nr:sorbosone dehydrogenase family protein [Cyclobacteriaceae bacterium]HNU40860.1 sorbosone dehydrogenase family protein [Cyclobacteriaceae bacterium]